MAFVESGSQNVDSSGPRLQAARIPHLRARRRIQKFHTPDPLHITSQHQNRPSCATAATQNPWPLNCCRATVGFGMVRVWLKGPTNHRNFLTQAHKRLQPFPFTKRHKRDREKLGSRRRPAGFGRSVQGTHLSLAALPNMAQKM